MSLPQDTKKIVSDSYIPLNWNDLIAPLTGLLHFYYFDGCLLRCIDLFSCLIYNGHLGCIGRCLEI